MVLFMQLMQSFILIVLFKSLPSSLVFSSFLDLKKETPTDDPAMADGNKGTS